MRVQRISLLLFAVYMVFIFGGYGQRVNELRWFNHILLTVIASGWLGWRIIKNRNLPATPMNWPVYAMLALGFLTIPFSDSPRMALEYMWIPMIYTLMFFVIVNMFHHAQHQFVIEMLFFITAVSIFLGVLQIVSVIWGLGIVRGAGQGWIEFIGEGIPLPVQQDLRIFLPFGVSTQTSGFFAPLIVISLAWAMSARKANRVLLVLLNMILFVMLILTFSRGGLVSLVVGLTAFFAIYISQTTRIKSLLTPRNLAIIGVLMFIAIVAVSTVISLGSNVGRVSGDRLRQDLWVSAVEMIQDDPVTGVGTGLYGMSLREYRTPSVADDRMSTAHNLYLNTTAENGLGVVLILAGTAILVVVLWWRQLNSTEIKSERWYLLCGMFAGLTGYLVHNLFDTLNIFGLVALATVMIIYITVEPAKSRLAPIQAYTHRLVAGVFLLIIVAYGVWFVAVVDRAHMQFAISVSAEENQLEVAERAVQIDPQVDLYTLQTAYLKGRTAIEDPTEENLQDAIEAHELALSLEPTWDTGMYNLAALHELDGNLAAAEDWVTQGRAIAPRRSLDLHWARILEETGNAPDDEIINAYLRGIINTRYLPLSSFWTETGLRLQSLIAYSDRLPVDRQYRIARVHFPDQIESLVLERPETAPDWWVFGEQLLTVDNDSQSAIDAFSRAIGLDAGNGDYYASRARARGLANRDAALRDLQIARFLGTTDEYPTAIEANLEGDPEIRDSLIIRSIPSFFLSQEFEAVLYAGRTAQFVPYDSVRQIGRGEPVIQIWYDLAEEYEVNGDFESALALYQRIRLHAPEDDRVYEALEQFETRDE